MAGTKIKPGHTGGMAAALTAGVISSLLATVFGAAIIAKLVDSEIIGESGTGYGVMIILVLAAYVGAALSYRRHKSQRLIVCMAEGAIYFGILICITALFFGGKYSGVGAKGMLVLCGSTLGILPIFERNNRRKRKKIKITNC